MKNRVATYETLLKDGADVWCARPHILGDTIGVCGYLNARLLNDNTARERLMETLDLTAPRPPYPIPPLWPQGPPCFGRDSSL